MISKEQYEQTCFSIISAAGTAKSCFLEAIESAKAKQPYKELLEEGNKAFIEASKAHAKALQYDASEGIDIGLLLIHAETILCSAETIMNLSETIIDLLK